MSRFVPLSEISVSTLGFDIDQTLIDSTPVIDAFFNWLKAKGITHSRDIYRQTHCWRHSIPGHSPNDLFEAFMGEGKAPQPLPMPGAREAIELLGTFFEIHLVTARGEISLKHIQDHLDREIFSVAACQEVWACRGLPKVHAIQSFKPWFYMDDSVKELEGLIEKTDVKLIQFPAFHGRSVPVIASGQVIRLKACNLVEQEDPDILRAQAWQEATEIIFNSLPLPL